MLKWTARGAVVDPTAVQIRVAPGWEGRVAAGAPAPARPLTLAEIEANVRWFAHERAGPRTPACTSLVLSGLGEADPVALAGVVRTGRELGVTRVTLHAGTDRAVEPTLLHEADVVVHRVSTPAEVHALPASTGTLAVALVVVLDHDTLPRLGALVAPLVAARPAQVVFSWPFPGIGTPAPPPSDEVARAVRDPLLRLQAAEVRAGVKGVPLCTLSPGPAAGSWAPHAWRTSNRWYVDAAHQRDEALLFFPDVVRFAKPEGCRFCSESMRCDGVAEAWLRLGLTGALTPLHAGASLAVPPAE